MNQIDFDREVARLVAKNNELCESVRRLSGEYHAAINEPEYAGTRLDWQRRAFAAEHIIEQCTKIVADVIPSTECLTVDLSTLVELLQRCGRHISVAVECCGCKAEEADRLFTLLAPPGGIDSNKTKFGATVGLSDVLVTEEAVARFRANNTNNKTRG